MASWADVGRSAPDFAEAVRALFDAHRHKTLATLRQDGSPRISGIEAVFADGELWFGGWADSRKLIDLMRDPRFALHSATSDPDGWPGDAKVAGRAIEVADPAVISAVTGGASATWPPDVHRHFRADLSEVVLIRHGDPPDHLAIDFWLEGRGVRHVERR